MKPARNVLGAAALLSLMTPISGCVRPRAAPPSAAATAVHVVPTAVALEDGQGAQLSAEVDDSAGQPVGGSAIRFVSSDPQLLTVTSTGYVRALGPSGQAEIVVSGGGKQARVTVTIKSAAPTASAPIVATSPGADAGVGPVAMLANVDDGTMVMAPAGRRTLKVRALDATGHPEVGVTIHWQLESGGGTLSADTSTSDGSGVARTVLSADKHARSARVTAHAGDLARTIEIAIRAE